MKPMTGKMKEKLFDKNYRTIAAESDRGAALVAAALLELALQRAIENRLVISNTKKDELFDGANAPLGTFSAKIEMARRLGIIAPGLGRALHLFRKLRNDFAHRIDAQRFWEPRLKARTESLLRMNPAILNFIAKPSSITEAMSDPVSLRGLFDMYFAFIAMKLEERADSMPRIQPFNSPNQPPRRNVGGRPSSSGSPASKTPSSLGPRG